MSLYGDYIKEREGKDIIEIEGGFLTYKILDNGIYIEDLYIAPEFRKTGLASEMADSVAEIAKERGFTALVGSVCTNANNSTASMKVLLAYGFEIASVEGNTIYMKKEI